MDNALPVRFPKPVPTRTVVLIVGSVILALAVSAAYTFFTLHQLASSYLKNRAREVATAVDAQVRGPGRRNNPDVWQSAMSEAAQLYPGTVSFLALIDGSGGLLAGSGSHLRDVAAASPGIAVLGGERVLVHDTPISPGGRTGMGGMHSPLAGWRLRVGISASEAASIRQQAWAHILIVAAAIGTLVILSYRLLQTLGRYIELDRRESSERHLRDLGTMAATLAHEIRNPLGAMKGLTQLAQEQLPQDHQTQGLMRTVVDEAERLERLVTDLLTFARLPKPENRNFSTAELLESVRTLVAGRLGEAGVRLEAAAEKDAADAHSDPDLLRQVLVNVVGNAIDASPAGGFISVRTLRDPRAKELVIEVCDSGPGIGSRDPEELFQPFQTGKTRGTGLGLTVSRRIVESLGGTITLGNGPQGGACCTIRIPAGRI